MYLWSNRDKEDLLHDETTGKVEHVLQAAFDGFNACLLAYGQTGTGKTYSMMGATGKVEHVLQASFHGFNAYVFVYGQTGKEKINPMMGQQVRLNMSFRQLLMVSMPVCLPMVKQGQGRPTP